MKNMAIIFKALGDSTRLEIVQMLSGKKLCVCKILSAFNISQPAISHHLRILKQAGILLDQKEGKWVYYELNPVITHKLQVYVENINSFHNIDADENE